MHHALTCSRVLPCRKHTEVSILLFEVLLFLLPFQCGRSLPTCSLNRRFRSEWRVVAPCLWGPLSLPRGAGVLQGAAPFPSELKRSLAVLPWGLPTPFAFQKLGCVGYSVSSALLAGTAGYRYLQDRTFFFPVTVPSICLCPLVLPCRWHDRPLWSAITELMSVRASRCEWSRFPLPSLISSSLFLSVPPPVLSWIGVRYAVSFSKPVLGVPDFSPSPF